MHRQPPTTDRARNLAGVASLLHDGFAALQSDDVEHAESLFRRVVLVDPLSVEGWNALAETQIGARREMCFRWAEYAESIHRRRAKRTTVVHQLTGSQRTTHIWRVSAALGLGIITLGVVGTDIVYQERVLPNVWAGPLELGSVPLLQAEQQLNQHRERVSGQFLEIRSEDQSWRVPLVNLLHDVSPEMLQEIHSYGHEDQFVRRAVTRLYAFAGYEHRTTVFHIRESEVRALATEIVSRVERDRRDATLQYTPDGWSIIPEQYGRTLDISEVAVQIAQRLQAQVWDTDTVAPILVINAAYESPHYTARQLEPLRARLNELRSTPLEIRNGEQRWSVDRSVLMHVDVAADLDTLHPSEVLIQQYVEGLAGDVYAAPEPSYLVREGIRIRDMVPGRVGYELDREATVSRLKEAITRNLSSIDLPLHELTPPPGELEQLGLIAELGRGESQFLTYTSPSRDANVQAGGQDIDGVLIAPGEVFSFNQTVGAITWEKGYRWGEMIEAGVIVPSLGGGICQVSTTLFRAAFWSGLEIVERHNHTWRLPWYEIDAPAGMDATIALGGPDLKFRNNTPHHILIKVETDLEQKRQTVVIYGTPDGRLVEMEPVAGGNIGIRRHVKQGEAVLAEETFLSFYSQ